MSKTLWNGYVIAIPENVAKCPECGAQVCADVYETVLEDVATEWTVAEDGSGVHIECTHEDGDHYKMPYIDWLPLDAPIIRWLNATYDFSPREITPRTDAPAGRRGN